MPGVIGKDDPTDDKNRQHARPMRGQKQSASGGLSDFGTFDFEKVRAWPRTVGRGIGAAFEMAVLLGRNSFPSPGRG
jgi:hypothetical protein